MMRAAKEGRTEMLGRLLTAVGDRAGCFLTARDLQASVAEIELERTLE